MVAFDENIEHYAKTSPRARGQDRSCALSALRCSKLNPHAALRERATQKDAQLGSCSRDPIGYQDGQNLYRGYFAPNNMDPSGLTLSIHGDDQQRTYLLQLLNSLCPEAGGFSQATGSIQPVTPGFCDNDRKEVIREGATRSCLWKKVWVEAPGPYSKGKHPISCTCICKAISHLAHYRIRPWVIVIGPIWDPSKMYPPGGRSEPAGILDVDVKIGTPHVDEFPYSGKGDPDSPDPLRVRNVPFIMLGHELCGHSITRDRRQGREGAVNVENDLRKEHGVPGERDGVDHTW